MILLKREWAGLTRRDRAVPVASGLFPECRENGLSSGDGPWHRLGVTTSFAGGRVEADARGQ